MMTILILDDDQSIRNSLKLYLTEIGFNIEESHCVKEAWEILKTKKIDLILCDVIMPQTDGFTFLSELRLNSKYSLLPVIFLTARGLTQDRILGYKIGCDSYISKPFNIEELVVIIENLLNRYALIRLNIEKKQKNSLSSNLIKRDLKENFTPREQSVLDLVVNGLMNKQIAINLNISIRIVEKYVSRLFIKTKTQNRTELVKYALENNLTELN
uniref:Putative OmpR transcriptional regulator n=1 Tax=Cyanophora biloba TaxID=1489483 RepID=A0A2Z4HGA0_9EUKA|nr:putative OmpR transcriptional regulator [Cyanophora biloba]AWW13805.1 putative OmpR transcriptional regulator [Cyanophora biloba]